VELVAVINNVVQALEAESLAGVKEMPAEKASSEKCTPPSRVTPLAPETMVAFVIV